MRFDLPLLFIDRISCNLNLGLQLNFGSGYGFVFLLEFLRRFFIVSNLYFKLFVDLFQVDLPGFVGRFKLLGEVCFVLSQEEKLFVKLAILVLENLVLQQLVLNDLLLFQQNLLIVLSF